jgi:SSS family solute:Na+ symporter
LNLGRFNFPWHDYMIGAIGHVVLMVVGYSVSRLWPDSAPERAPE